jgi:hypothetical protein
MAGICKGRTNNLSKTSRLLAALCIAIGFTLAPEEAFANGRIPRSNQIVFAPNRPDTWLLRTTFGVLLSRDRGARWDWICETGMQYSGTQDPLYTILTDGTIAATAIEGLILGEPAACNFRLASGELMGRTFVDLSSAKNNPSSMVALTGDFLGASDAGFQFRSDIFRTDDSARTFTKISSSLDPGILTQTIDLAPSNPDVVYVSGTRGDQTPTGVFLRSEDRGATWQEYPITLVNREIGPFIAAVDPNNHKRVYVRTAGASASLAARLLVTDNGGETFREVFRLNEEMPGFTLSQNGSTVYLGGPADGLWKASAQDLVFRKVSDVQVQCLATRPRPSAADNDAGNGGNNVDGGSDGGSTGEGGSGSNEELFACSNEISGFLLGRSLDEGTTFQGFLRFRDIRGPLSCPAGSVATCTNEWPALRAELGLDPYDAGTDATAITDGGTSVTTTDGGVEAGNVGPPRNALARGGCADACTTGQASETMLPSSAIGAAGMLVGSMFVLRRRRNRRFTP